jgi:hypothetical protein
MTSAPAFAWGIPMNLRLPSVLSVVVADLHFPTEPHCLTLQLYDAFSLWGSSYSSLSASSGMTLLASMVLRISLLPNSVCTRSLVSWRPGLVFWPVGKLEGHASISSCPALSSGRFNVFPQPVLLWQQSAWDTGHTIPRGSHNLAVLLCSLFLLP